MTGWGKGEATSEHQAQLLIDWGFEGEFLQKSGKENEQLRPGQLFSQACSLSCGTKTEESLSQLNLVHHWTGVPVFLLHLLS